MDEEGRVVQADVVHVVMSVPDNCSDAHCATVSSGKVWVHATNTRHLQSFSDIQASTNTLVDSFCILGQVRYLSSERLNAYISSYLLISQD